MTYRANRKTANAIAESCGLGVPENIKKLADDITDALNALTPRWPQIDEPVLTVGLEEDDPLDHDWHVRALRTLAHQLGVGNDYYHPLLNAANLLNDKDAEIESLKRELALHG